MKTWHVILLWLISRFLLGAFNLDAQILRAVYFIGNDLFMIAFFAVILQTEDRKTIRRLYFAGLYYSIGILFDNCLLFAGIGNVSKWYYEIMLFSLTIAGYLYGNSISKLCSKNIRLDLGFLRHVFNRL